MTDNDTRKLDLFSRRAVIVGSLQLSLISLLFGRLFYLQFIRNFDYKIMSENNRVRISIVIPLRGKIYDRRKVVLADNRQVYRLLLDKDSGIEYLPLLEKVVSLLSLSQEDLTIFIKKIKKSKINEVVLLDD